MVHRGVTLASALCALLAVGSACVYSVGSGLSVDLSGISLSNEGPVDTDDGEETIIFRLCTPLQYEMDFFPEGNGHCDDTDHACLLVDGAPAFKAGKTVSFFGAGNNSVIEFSNGEWCEEYSTYRKTVINLECGTTEGIPAWSSRDRCTFYLYWQTSAACAFVSEVIELPWDRTGFPAPQDLIHRGRYSFTPSAVPDVPIGAYIVTSDRDALDEFNVTKTCIETETDPVYTACTILELVEDIEVSIRDVVEIALVVNETSGVYLTATPEYFVEAELSDDFGRSLFAYVPANVEIPVLTAHRDRAVSALTYRNGSIGSGVATFFSIENYQLAKAGTNPLTPGAKVGVLFAIIIGVIGIGIGIYVYYRRRRAYQTLAQ